MLFYPQATIGFEGPLVSLGGIFPNSHISSLQNKWCYNKLDLFSRQLIPDATLTVANVFSALHI